MNEHGVAPLSSRETGATPCSPWSRRAPVAVAFLGALVVLGPLLLPGFPLRYDLVTVPRPVLGEDALGLGDRLPRAIPLDGATAALALVLPDAVVTQLLALLALTLAGWGAARLTPAGLPGRTVAAFVAVWNPLVLEQLAIGHVPHLFAYGALPWAALFAHRLARGGDARTAWGGLVLVCGFGSLTPGGGVLCVLATLAGLLAGAAGGAAGRWRRVLLGFVPVALLQLPWLSAGVLYPAVASATGAGDDGLALFALRSETGWGRLVDALGLAGMWNGQSLPASRDTVLAQASTVLVLVAVAGGAPGLARLWRAGYRPEVAAGLAAAAAGYVVAVLPVLPGGTALLRALVDAVPGAGLLRDGHRWLALPAVGVAVLAGLAVDAASRRLPVAQGAAVAVLAGCLVVATMPDLAGGLAGRLTARHYPADWAAARAVLDDSPDRARVLVLPWQAFRRFSWTGPDPVLDPAPRLLPRQVVVSDALRVGDRRVGEEGAGARAAAAALADGELTDAELRSLSVGWVLVERSPGEVPGLPADWRPVVEGPELTLLRAPDPLPAAPRATALRAVTVVTSHSLAVLLLAAGAGLLVARKVTRRYQSRRDASPAMQSGTKVTE
jgi:hypothetical protein